MIVAVGQQCQEPRAIHGVRQLALVARLGAGDAARHDLAGFGDVLTQDIQVLVVNLLHALGGETAELLAAKEFGHVRVSGFDEAYAASSRSLRSSKLSSSRRRGPFSSL